MNSIFFQTFNSVCRIGEVLLKLQQHGHDKYVCWMQRFGCRAEDLVGRLNEIAKELEDDLERWKEKIAHGRQKFYHLNYFTTQQLLSLRRELGSFKGGNPDRSVKPETLALLQSISRDITQRNVIKDLQKALADTTPPHSHPSTSQDGTSHSAALDDNGVGDSTEQHFYEENEQHTSGVFEEMISDEVLADLPLPQLSVDELTDTQRGILDNLKGNNGFPTKLVLLAFDRCARPDSEEEIELWCLQHDQQFQYPESDVESDASSQTVIYHYEGEGMSVEVEEERMNFQESVLKYTKEDPPSKKKQTTRAKIRVRQQVPIDEYNSSVVELIESGFSLEQSMDAISRYPDNVTAALNYLTEQNEAGALFQSDVSTEELFGTSAADIGEVISDGFSVEPPNYFPHDVYKRQESSSSNVSQSP